jgi:cytohesin
VGVAVVLAGLVAGCGDEKPQRDLRMWSACLQGNVESVREMLAREPSLAKTRELDGDTPLHHAVECAAGAEIVRLLLDAGADADASNKKGQTPLDAAAHWGRYGEAKVLLERGAKISPERVAANLHTALLNGNAELVQLAAGYGYSASGPAMDAGLGRLEELEQQLAADPGLINRSQFGGPLLCYAAANGQRDVVRLLLRQGADIEAQAWCGGALSYAAMAAEDAVVELLLRAGADVKARCATLRRTPLHWAAASGTPNTLQLLIDHGADPQTKDALFQTPLNLARGPVKAGILRRATGSVPAEP